MGLSFNQARKKSPRTSIPIPVQRLMFTPCALSMSSSDATKPAIVTMTP